MDRDAVSVDLDGVSRRAEIVDGFASEAVEPVGVPSSVLLRDRVPVDAAVAVCVGSEELRLGAEREVEGEGVGPAAGRHAVALDEARAGGGRAAMGVDVHGCGAASGADRQDAGAAVDRRDARPAIDRGGAGAAVDRGRAGSSQDVFVSGSAIDDVGPRSADDFVVTGPAVDGGGARAGVEPLASGAGSDGVGSRSSDDQGSIAAAVELVGPRSAEDLVCSAAVDDVRSGTAVEEAASDAGGQRQVSDASRDVAVSGPCRDRIVAGSALNPVVPCGRGVDCIITVLQAQVIAAGRRLDSQVFIVDLVEPCRHLTHGRRPESVLVGEMAIRYLVADIVDSFGDDVDQVEAVHGGGRTDIEDILEAALSIAAGKDRAEKRLVLRKRIGADPGVDRQDVLAGKFAFRAGACRIHGLDDERVEAVRGGRSALDVAGRVERGQVHVVLDRVRDLVEPGSGGRVLVEEIIIPSRQRLD